LLASVTTTRKRAMSMPPNTVISIVDDDDDVRSGLEALLLSLDYMVHTFASAEEFLKSRDLHQTSCVISDVRMPGLSGIDLQALLHAEGRYLPMIFITAYPDNHLRDRAMRAGAISFLSKPIREADLLLCIDRALKKS
jgi:FixJ family two-component response regulator